MLPPAKVVVALSLVTMAALPALLVPRNWTAAELLAVMEVIPVVSAFATVNPPLPFATTAPVIEAWLPPSPSCSTPAPMVVPPL